MRQQSNAPWRNSQRTKKRRLEDTAYRRDKEFAHPELPIHSRRIDIMKTLSAVQVMILQGDTGCGKTTQLPQFIVQEYPNCKVAVTQPRRLAAIGVARRVSKELGTSLGTTVGYHIRGEKRYGPDSKIVFMTTGMFIQELVGITDDLPWTHIILDEVHERAVETEFLLVVLKHILSKCPTKLILMSATIDARLFANYFADSEIHNVHNQTVDPDSHNDDWAPNQFKTGITKTSSPFEKDREDAAPIKLAGPKNFEVKEIYLDEIAGEMINELFQLSDVEREEQANYYRDELVEILPSFYKIAAYLIRAQHILRIFEEQEPQTFLIFLPGIHEINKMAKVLLEDVMKDCAQDLEICMLHSSIPEENHANIFSSPEGKRRIIISTNIAESSITLPDVRYIIDFCLTKEITYNSKSMSEMLELHWACKAVMKQRAGRAGRVAEGVVFRLIPSIFYEELADFSKPEIQRCPLDKLVLKVKQLALGTPVDILGRCIQPPDIAEVKLAEKYLREMGALSEELNLTWLGRVYSDMPCDVKISRLCLFGYIFGCLHESLVMASALSQEKNVFASCSHLDYKIAKYESQRYAMRLRWDNYAFSDPIAYMRAYQVWYQQWGKVYKNKLEDSYRHTRKPEISFEEKQWCKANSLDYSVLREMCETYMELERRLIMIGLSKEHLKNRLGTSQDDILTLKLCLAAAYNGKYLISHYAYEDEVMRRKREQQLGENSSSKVLIPNIPDYCRESDIARILSECRSNHINMNFEYGNAVLTFDPTEGPRPLQMCLWLGNYGPRYRCGDFIIVKKNIRNEQRELINSMDPENLAQHINFIARQQPREGMSFLLGEENFVGNKIFVEAFCLPRPEYLYRLGFIDLLTGLGINIDEYSVCKVCVENNPLMEQLHMAVCTEFTEKRNKTTASHVTVFPKFPLLPHILSMIFTRDINFFQNNGKYGGIMVGTTVLKFKFNFTGKDVEEINDIRKEISEALFDEKGILNPKPLQVKDKIIRLITKRRLPLIDEQWRHVLESFNPYDVVPYKEEVIKGEDGADLPKKIEVYLKPLTKLPDVIDDVRLWSEEGQRAIEKEMYLISLQKEDFVQKIKNDARAARLNRAELICKECKMTICAYFNANPVNINPASGVFTITGIFASVKMLDDLRDEQINCDFIRNFQYSLLDVDKWASCMEGHIIGWESQGKCFIDHTSPLLVMMPSGGIFDWSSKLWAKGIEDFRNLCRSHEDIKKQKPKKTHCDLCKLDCIDERDFYHHVIISKEHSMNVTAFLRDGF